MDNVSNAGNCSSHEGTCNCRFLTDAITEVSEKSGLSEAFLGLIILPIAGNACEHITAVLVAYKNKMNLAIGVALGSSIQIAIFVLPVLVLIGYASSASAACNAGYLLACVHSSHFHTGVEHHLGCPLDTYQGRDEPSLPFKSHALSALLIAVLQPP